MQSGIRVPGFLPQDKENGAPKHGNLEPVLGRIGEVGITAEASKFEYTVVFNDINLVT